jgi:HK97 family phage portal protein
MKLNLVEKYFLNRILSKEEKQSKTTGAIMTGIPGGVVWPTRDYENFSRETYMKNVIAFCCIDITSKSVASVPWKLFQSVIDPKTQKLKRETVKKHPINAILKRANPRESFTFVVLSHMCYLLISGNAFIERVGPSTGDNQGIIKELYTLRPDRMKILTNALGISGYEYQTNGQTIIFPADPVTGKCDILHMKLFHPLDDFWGMSTTEPAAINIDSHNTSSMWNKNLTENEARPGALFLFENTLNDEVFNRLKKQITEKREGARFAGKSLIVDGGVKDVKPYGFSPKEMDWLKSNIELARNICNAYHVPPQMIGIPDTSTYSNYQEARQAFWEETVTFYLQYLADELNYWLFPNENLDTEENEQPFIDYLLNDVPAFEKKRNDKWDRIQKSDFLKINEKREAVDYEGVDEGDVLLVSATMIPLGEEQNTEDETAKQEEETVKKLMEQGYTREEALEQIGVPVE